MASQNYPRLSIEDFGRHLLVDGDLDPIYVIMNKSNLDHDHKCRWLLAYTAFYNAGVASYLSERKGEDFWHAMLTAAENATPTPIGTRWARGKERRHFRGAQGIAAVLDWKHAQPIPEERFNILAEGSKGEKVSTVIGFAKEMRGVGDWMAFKIADLLDACLGCELDQSEVGLFMYDTPRKSALRIWREHYRLPESAKPKNEDEVLMGVLEHLNKHFKDYNAPHKPGHPVDMFCLETILCKHLSHLNGHYPKFNDITEIDLGLEEWIEYSPTALELLKYMPKIEGQL